MAAPLEEILHKLLVPDSAVIQQGTHELKEAFKDPSIVPSLCNILLTSTNPQIRQLAAVLLRRRIIKQWTKVDPQVQHNLQEVLLPVVLQEPEKSVRNGLAQLVGSIAKHELTNNAWPQLLEFLQENSRSQNVQHREVAGQVLSSVASSAGEYLRPHYRGMFALFTNMLQDPQSKLVPYYAIRCMTDFVQYIGSDEIALFRPMIPGVLVVIGRLLEEQEDQGCEAMELLDELVECEVSIVVPHIKPCVEFCCQVARNDRLGDNARVKALSFISSLTRLKKKAILKHKLVGPILRVLFPIMSSPHEDEDEEEDDDEEDEAESHTPSSFAAQVVDVMALHLPPEKLIPPLLQLVQPALQSQNPYERKAGLLSMAMLAEGCADFIRNKHLQALLHCICGGITDPHPAVRNAALFALGQFSEHLQPDISKYHADLLPLLFDYLSKASQTADEKPKGITKTYYALEMFCENLGNDLLPYLPTLMERLLLTLQNSSSVHVKELAISAIGATANAAKEHMLPFFGAVMEQLKVYLTSSYDSGDALILQVQSIDTLGVLARTLGQENFLPLAEESLQLGLKLMKDIDDPDLRRCTYGLFASLSSVLKENMAAHLPTITKVMINSIKSTEGVVAHYNKDETSALALFDDESSEDIEDSDEENDTDEEDIQGYSVENAYLEEKEDACNSLGEIASNTGTAFLPHLEECFQEVFRLLDYPAPNVRKAAITTTGQLCCTLCKALPGNNDNDASALSKVLDQTLPLFVHIINTETDRTVVMATLETLKEMLSGVGVAMVTEQGNLSSITSSIRNVLQGKTACQDQDEDDEDDEDGDQAELDAMLIECAGDLIPGLAQALGGQIFAPYFAGALPLLLTRTKKSCTAAEKSFAVGMLAETVVALKESVQPFIPHLMPVFLRMIQEEDEEVRSNAVFGIGVLTEHGKEQIFQHYPTILQALSAVIAKEEDRRVMDNVCGSVCRLIMTNPSLVPLDQVVPTLLQYLPLEEDLEENLTVYRCVAHLYQANQTTVMQSLPQLLTVFGKVLTLPDITQDLQVILVGLVKSISQHQADIFNAVVSSIPQEIAQILSQAAIS
ncbi:importin-4-like [Amphiura filiformis]|uniref:importin-4-like n=1 Tax=Amphiura filiformis TaxID=82378 RepID=UPI003B21292F